MRAGGGAGDRSRRPRDLLRGRTRSARPELPASGVAERLLARLAAGDLDGLLSEFMLGVVGMTQAELDGYRGEPVSARAGGRRGHDPARAGGQAAPRGVAGPSAGSVRQPVLQLLSWDGRTVFRDATVALDARLANGRVVEIAGAGRAAHHAHPDVVVEGGAQLPGLTSGVTPPQRLIDTTMRFFFFFCCAVASFVIMLFLRCPKGGFFGGCFRRFIWIIILTILPYSLQT